MGKEVSLKASASTAKTLHHTHTHTKEKTLTLILENWNDVALVWTLAGRRWTSLSLSRSALQGGGKQSDDDKP